MTERREILHALKTARLLSVTNGGVGKRIDETQLFILRVKVLSVLAGRQGLEPR